MSIFALVDCNNFFVSCERTADPGLTEKPVVVLSNNDGCIISRSDEVRQLDIPMGVPYFKIKNLLEKHRVRVFSANFPFYYRKSVQVIESLQKFTPLLEYYSIDEAFLSLNGTPPEKLNKLGRQIRETVLHDTGVPVSVGIAQTKTLAKLANQLCKRSRKANGLLNLYKSPHLDLALSRTPVGSVWGVGRRLTPSLQGAGIYTARDLRDADDKWVLRRFSVVTLRTVLELRGTMCHPITESVPPKKSVLYSRSFGNLVGTLAQMESAVAAYTARAAEKLREDGLAARELTLYFRTSRYIPEDDRFATEDSAILPAPTNCTHDLIHEALRLTRRMYRGGYQYYKAAVLLTGIVPDNEIQTSLFETRDVARLQTLMHTMDRINASYGSGTLQYAAEGFKQEWRSRQEKLSEAPVPPWRPENPKLRPRIGFVHPVLG